MKRYLCAAMAAALLAPALWTVSAYAQEDGPPPEHADKDKGDHRGRDAMAEKMKEKLGLNADQAKKFQDAMKSHGETMKATGEQMKDAVAKLRDQLKAKAKDEEIAPTLDALKTARKAMMEENDKFETELAGFLTPTQRAKMAVGMAAMMRRGGPGGRMGDHGRGGRGGRGDDKGGERGDDGGRGGPKGDDDAGE